MPRSTASERCTDAARPDGYARRRPEDTLLHRLVSEHWPIFHARAEEQGGLPRFVVREMQEYLRCGILEHGLAAFQCRGCGHELVVAFSCKRRGFCPSCLGRRMSDVAAHLCDEVLPEVPVRQWVCSFPWSIRYALGYDRQLFSDVLDAFARALARSLRRRAKKKLGLRSVGDALVGAITFVQRSDASLRLNPHLHTLALDGVYVRDVDGTLRFHELGAPSNEEVLDVARFTYERLVRVLERHGRALEGEGDAPDALAAEEPVLASCYAASAADVQLLGAAPGQRTDKLARPVRLAASPRNALAEHGGVNVHANVVVDGRDRRRLERLVRYVARPPLAQERLELSRDGRVRLRFKAPWKDGTDAILLHPLDFISRLCALVPAPRFHLLRYHGVLSAHAAARREVVPGRAPLLGEQLPLFHRSDAGPLAPAPSSRHPWQWLLSRVFAVEIRTCPHCGGSMRLVTIAKTPTEVATVLEGRAPRARAPPPLPGQLALDFAAA